MSISIYFNTSQQQELEREMPFKITFNSIKYLGIYLPKQTQELYKQGAAG